MGKKVKEGGEGGLKVKLTLNSYEIVIGEREEAGAKRQQKQIIHKYN